MPKYEDPFAFESKKVEDPFPEESAPKPVIAPEPYRPHPLRALVTAAGQVPKMIGEGVVGTGNALLQSWGNAMAPFDVAGGLLSGKSLEESAEIANRRIKANQAWNPIPSFTGSPSWLAQGMGAATNELVKRGVTTPENLQVIGQELALLGTPNMLGAIKSPLAAGTENLRTRYNVAFKDPKVLAGEVWERTGKTLPKGTAESAAERAGTATRLFDERAYNRDLGVERLPMQQDAYLGRQQLAAQRAKDSSVAYKAQEMRGGIAGKQAESGFERVFPRVKTDQGRLEFVTNKLQSVGKDAVTARLEAEADAAAAKFGEIVPKTDRPAPVVAGRQILERVRGVGSEGEKVNTGIRAVQEVFNEEYKKFDTPEAVAPSKDLHKALKATATESVNAGQMLRNYVDVKGKVEGKIGKQLAETLTLDEEARGMTAGEVVLPENLTLKQFRGLKGEFAAARDAATASKNYPAAREYGKLMEAARNGENAAAEALGPEMAEQYASTRAAYKQLLVNGFRRGYGGELASFGREVGDFSIAPADVFKSLMDTQNARDFSLTMGAEEAAKTGKAVSGLGEKDLVVLGQSKAQSIVRPYIESELSEAYAKGGVEAVTKYLDKHQDALRTYGLDFNELRSGATKYNEAMNRISGAKLAVSKGVVEGVIGQTDATKLGSYVFDAASPANSYKNLLGVSKDLAWKPSIDTLLTDELRARMRTGIDVFADPKSLSLMEAMWTPEQMRTAKSFNRFWSRMKEKPAKYGGEDLPAHPLEGMIKMGSAYPPGFGVYYVAKNVAKRLAGKKVIDDTEAAWNYIDAAILEPDKAAVIEGALKGHRAAVEKLRAGVNAEESALKRLAVKGAIGVAKRVPVAVPGVAAKVAAKPPKASAPDFSSMDDSTFMALP